MTPPDDFNPVIGRAETLEPGLRRIVAPNPSPMTYRGTNTYLVGTRDLAVVDPGPLDPAHLDAILGALRPDQRISHIVVSHSHLDHSPLARPLAERSGARVFAFGAAHDGRSEIMQRLASTGLVGGGEGVDTDFVPDAALADGESLDGDGWRLEAIHTPGHIGNHLCLAYGDACLTADHVMGWSSSLVSPPDGDLTDFMTSCLRLQQRKWRVFYPGHGDAIHDPAARLDWLMTHRKGREASILRCLEHGPATAAELAQIIYADTAPGLLPAATRNVLAHLIDLTGKSQIRTAHDLHADAAFELS